MCIVSHFFSPEFKLNFNIDAKVTYNENVKTVTVFFIKSSIFSPFVLNLRLV